MSASETVVIGFLGTTLDTGSGPLRWERWRPSVSLCQHEDLLVNRLELLHEQKFDGLASTVAEDVHSISPETEVRSHIISYDDPWDFEGVYGVLLDFARAYPFDVEREDYLVHITTGTHVAQICLFLLTESRYIPARLLQTMPDRMRGCVGDYRVIDLDLSRYDQIASRFREEVRQDLSFLKSGIETRNARFNRLIEQIEWVAIRSKAPLLLMGPTGAGKSHLAKRICELKKSRRQIAGRFVEVNCATIRGDAAMSALFGHIKGAFTGAVQERPGLIRSAHDGVLFLDEIGELGLDEQALLLRALEEKVIMPVGADREVRSDFQLIAGTNRDLVTEVEKGRFREDLLSRINLWTFHLPGLKDRREDIAPNLEYELEKYARENGVRVTFSREAREGFLAHAESPAAEWRANFRDLNAAMVRMATLAPGGRITPAVVEEEIARLDAAWKTTRPSPSERLLEKVLDPDQLAALDRFDRVQLADVLQVCQEAPTLSQAGRLLFSASRQLKQKVNDADRLRKYLSRYGLEWKTLKTALLLIP